MKQIQDMVRKKSRPIRVIQFGEGNFLRAFADWMIDIANEKGIINSGIVLIKPIPHGNLDAFRKQDHLYTVLLRGKEDGLPMESSRMNCHWLSKINR